MLDLAKWKYGPDFDAPPNSKIWNPVMIKMMKGEKVTGGTVFSTDSPETYCAMANAGYDFIWTEMQHDSRDWGAVAKMWRACPHAKAVPGVRVAYTDRAGNPACHGSRCAGDRGSHGPLGGRGKSREGLDDVPAAREAQLCGAASSMPVF